GLPPHPLELKRLGEHWCEVVECASNAEVIIVTHYHYDHHSPWDDLNIYDDKLVLVKHPKEKINRSQVERSAFFLEQIKGKPRKLEYCDDKSFTFGDTVVKFSKPVYHGTNPKLGYVVEVLIEDGLGEKFLFTSDVEGLSVQDQVEFILESKPEVLYVDGPMTYMLGYRYSLKSFNESVKNLVKVAKICPLKTLILDHHLLRDLEWENRVLEVVKEASKRKVKVTTAAKFAGKPQDMLEARRKELYEKYPVSEGEELKTGEKFFSGD
ncbi:MAG: hypothetical protein N3E48_00585, partial [Candidatus Bathyarchaeota archaeon]|nr:hypothetical protein [Candidatus Bathyarchaeota archaeon]